MFTLEALRYYGEEGPIAIIRTNGRTMAYTRLGIDALIIKYKGQSQQSSLLAIKVKMLKHGDYKDIQDTDFSGQEELFA
mgnify:CR=1 FL=1